MGEIKAFLFKVFLFTGAAAVVYCLMLFGLANFGPDFVQKNVKYRRGVQGHTFSRLREIDTVRNIDVLIVGSSQAYRSFDPRIFEKHGIKAFNLGTSAQTMLQTNFLLYKYLDKVNPRMVIWEVWPNSLTSDGTESLSDLVSNAKNPIELAPLAAKVGSVTAYNTFLVSAFNYLTGVNQDIVEPTLVRRDSYVGRGFVERHQQFQKSAEIIPPLRTFNQSQIKHFHESLKLLKDRNIKVLLVDAPVAKRFYRTYSNNQAFDSLYSSLVRHGLAKAYVNFNEYGNLTLNDTLHFYDYDHLNQDGVVKFNEALLNDGSLNLRAYFESSDSQGLTKINE